MEKMLSDKIRNYNNTLVVCRTIRNGKMMKVSNKVEELTVFGFFYKGDIFQS